MKSKLLISSTPLQRTTVLSLRSNGHSQTRMCILKIIDGHIRLQSANYPTSTELAGIDMRFDEEAVRELHGHREMEWAAAGAQFKRSTSFYSECQQGWVRVHANGNSSEDKILLLSNWLAHTPKGVMAKNFGLDPSVFEKLSQKGDELSTEKYLFRGVAPDTSSSLTFRSLSIVSRTAYLPNSRPRYQAVQSESVLLIPQTSLSR